MDWYPHVTVATIVEKEGKFLLVEELSHGNLVINQPAGHLDANESLQEAAARETLEETGWTVNIQGIVGLALYTSPQNHVTYQRTTFYASAVSYDDTYQLDDGIQQALWMSYEDMLAASAKMRSHLVIKSVEQFMQGHRYPLGLIYD